MTTARAVARGTSRLLVGLLAAKALDFTFYLMLARRLGVEQFGHYAFALSFTLLFNILADMGVSTVVTRELARAPQRTRALLAEALGLKLGLAFLTVIATSAITWVTHAPRITLVLVAILTVAMLINSAALLFEGVLKVAGRSGAAGLSVLAQSITAMAVGMTLVLSGHGALGGACAYLLAAFMHLIAAAAWSRDLWGRLRPRTPGRVATGSAHLLFPQALGTKARVAKAPGMTSASESARETLPADSTEQSPAPEPAWHGWRGLLRESAPLAFSGAFIAIYFRIDSVLVQFFKGASAVGLYSGTYRFFEAFALLATAYRSVLYPIMARTADGPAEALGVLCRKSLRLHLMFTIGVAVFVTFQARAILMLVLGPAYAPAAASLAWLMWALPGSFMADTLLHLLTSQRRQSVGARAVGVTACFNLLANLILIPQFSYFGAAATTAVSEALCFTLLFVGFSRSVPKINLFGVARAPLIAGGIAAAAMLLLSPLNPGGAPGLALMGLFAMAAYVLALIALGALSRQDAELVQEVLPAALRLLPAGERRKP